MPIPEWVPWPLQKSAPNALQKANKDLLLAKGEKLRAEAQLIRAQAAQVKAETKALIEMPMVKETVDLLKVSLPAALGNPVVAGAVVAGITAFFFEDELKEGLGGLIDIGKGGAAAAASGIGGAGARAGKRLKGVGNAIMRQLDKVNPF